MRGREQDFSMKSAADLSLDASEMQAAWKESIVIEDIDGLSSALADDKNKPLSTHTTDGSCIYRCESKGLAVLSSKFNYKVRIY